MPFRITQSQITDRFVQQIFEKRIQLQDVQDQISSGIKVARPGDAPATAGIISNLSGTVNRLERHKDRISYSESILNNQESILQSGQDLLIRAKELATQGANEVYSVEQRRSMAIEVFELRDAMVGLANSKFQGVYVYGGVDNDDPPYDQQTYTNPATPPADPSAVRWVFDNETGTTTTRNVQISDDDSVRINTAGDIWANSISALERLGRSLAGYRTTPEDLSTLPTGAGAAFNLPTEYHEQTAAIRALLDPLDAARVELNDEQSDLGGRQNRLTQASQIMDTVIFNTKSTRSTLQDADQIEAASNLNNLQISLQALLASGSQLNRISLLDYL